MLLHMNRHVCFFVLLSLNLPSASAQQDNDPPAAAEVAAGESIDSDLSEGDASDQSLQSTARPAPDVSEVIQGLGSADFEIRQRAAASLQSVPADRISALVDASEATSCSEVTRRVFEYLESCYRSDDDRSRVAGEILEHATTDPHWMTAELASDILDRNSRVRITRSLLELQTLGASVRPRDPNDIWRRRYSGPVGIVGLGVPDDQVRIDVGENWEGSVRGMELFERLSPLVADPQGFRGLRFGIYLIDGHPMSADEVSSLKATFGDRRVVSRGKVCLGITSDPWFGDNVGCKIGSVTKRSSAGDAGLKQGDTILRMNDDEVKDFDHLVELLKQFEPGDEVIMTVRRAPDGRFPGQPYRLNQLMDLPVVLKGWDSLD